MRKRQVEETMAAHPATEYRDPARREVLRRRLSEVPRRSSAEQDRGRTPQASLAASSTLGRTPRPTGMPHPVWRDKPAKLELLLHEEDEGDENRLAEEEAFSPDVAAPPRVMFALRDLKLKDIAKADAYLKIVIDACSSEENMAKGRSNLYSEPFFETLAESRNFDVVQWVLHHVFEPLVKHHNGRLPKSNALLERLDVFAVLGKLDSLLCEGHLLPQNRKQVLCLRERLALALGRAALGQKRESHLRRLFFESTLPEYENYRQESVVPRFKKLVSSVQSPVSPSELNKAMLEATSDSLDGFDGNRTLIQETMMDFSEDDDEAHDCAEDELEHLEDLDSESNLEAVGYTEGWLRARQD